MPDEAFYEKVWNGAQAIEALSQHAPTQELLQAAEQLRARLYAGVRGPVVAYIATRGESAVTEYEATAMDTFVAAAKQLPSEYSQPAFQCLEDFEKCRTAGTSAFMCGLALAICLVERLIPKKEEHVRQEKEDDIAFSNEPNFKVLDVSPERRPIAADATKTKDLANKQLAKLRQNLTECFTDEELHVLCFDMGIDYEDLGGQIKSAKAMALVTYCKYRGIVPQLVEACRKLRPNLSWEI